MRLLKTGASVLLVGFLAAAVEAATLERLAMEDMARKSSVIVRARVTGTYAALHGSTIYTHYSIQILETWKTAGAGASDVVVPGGVAGGLRQTFSGSPRLMAGREYVLFLWTAPRSGLTHIIGLTQGLFNLQRESNGEVVASRAATNEPMLDRSGRPVQDEPLRLRLSDLRQRVSRALASGGSR